MDRRTLWTVLQATRSMYGVTKWDTFLSPISEAPVKALHDRWLPDIAAAAHPEVNRASMIWRVKAKDLPSCPAQA